jgi:hypothetical protein
MTGKKVCRFHGGKAGAPSGPRNGRYRTGLHTAAAIASRISVRELIRTARSLMAAGRGRPQSPSQSQTSESEQK